MKTDHPPKIEKRKSTEQGPISQKFVRTSFALRIR